jgi:NADP-dependent 3-hydroxy acid dehydrogenase YdfG
MVLPVGHPHKSNERSDKARDRSLNARYTHGALFRSTRTIWRPLLPHPQVESPLKSEGILALKGQVALITGASSGVGQAIALLLAGAGATLCCVGRHLDTLQQVAVAAGLPSERAHFWPTDLSQDQDLQTLEARIRTLDRLDILIHAAGDIILGSATTVPLHDLDRQYQVNVRAPYAITQAALPLLIAGQGQVVFLNSSAGQVAGARNGQYAATKHALKGLADSLRAEVNGHGIRVLSVFLGRTATPMQAAVAAMEGTPYQPERLIQPEDVASVVVHALGLPRSVEMTEVSLRPLAKPLGS